MGQAPAAPPAGALDFAAGTRTLRAGPRMNRPGSVGSPRARGDALPPVALVADGPGAPPPTASLQVNFYWTLGGNLVAAACKALQLMLLAKAGTPDMVGQFAFALAVTAPVVMLTNLQLRNVQATDAQGQFSFETYLGVRLAGNVLALGAIVLVAALRGTPGALWIVIAMAVAKVVEATSDVFHGLVQRHERMDVVARSLIAKELLALGAMAAALLATGSVVWATLALAAGSLVVLAGYDLPQGRAVWRATRGAGALRPSLRSASKLVRLALPLGVVMMLASLGANVPRYVVEHRLGVRELGVFSAVSYVMFVGLTAVGALGHSAAPRLARHHAAGDRLAFVRLMLRLLALAAFLGVAGVAASAVAGRTLLHVLYRAEYAEAQPVLVWTMVAGTAAFVGSALDYGLTAARSLRAQAPLWIVMVAVTAAACAVLVPRHGLVGAAAGAGVGYAVQAAGAGWLLARALRRQRATP
jgi:O-antigen/teichoic acid export membrane protein